MMLWRREGRHSKSRSTSRRGLRMPMQQRTMSLRDRLPMRSAGKICQRRRRWHWRRESRRHPRLVRPRAKKSCLTLGRTNDGLSGSEAQQSRDAMEMKDAASTVRCTATARITSCLATLRGKGQVSGDAHTRRVSREGRRVAGTKQREEVNLGREAREEENDLQS